MSASVMRSVVAAQSGIVPSGKSHSNMTPLNAQQNTNNFMHGYNMQVLMYALTKMSYLSTAPVAKVRHNVQGLGMEVALSQTTVSIKALVVARKKRVVDIV
eukprot:475995-Amphidinium_carterae.1